MGRRIELEPDALVVRYSGIAAATRFARGLSIPYEQVRLVSVGLDDVPPALAFRVGLTTAPFGTTRKGHFWRSGRRLFLDFEDPSRAVVLDLEGNKLARVAVEPDTDPEALAGQIRERISGARA